MRPVNRNVSNVSKQKIFKYVGLNIEQKQGYIYLDQQMYTGKLREVDISRDRRISKESPLSTEETQQLRGLNWTSSQTRPGMSFGACEVSVSIKHPNVEVRRSCFAIP